MAYDINAFDGNKSRAKQHCITRQQLPGDGHVRIESNMQMLLENTMRRAN